MLSSHHHTVHLWPFECAQTLQLSLDYSDVCLGDNLRHVPCTQLLSALSAKRIKIHHDSDNIGDHGQESAELSASETADIESKDEDNADSGKDSEVITEGEINREGNLSADMSDAASDVSALSDMSGLSGEDSWKATPSGPMGWIYKCMEDGVDPRSILRQIVPDETDIPDLDNFTLWKLVVNLVSEPPPRNKLPDINTLDDVLNLLQTSEKIMILTGAGVSVSCGIPDFRSRNGIYARLAVDFPDLPDPQAMFDIRYFRRDQRPFFKFAKEIYPGQFEPSRCHKFIQLIEHHGKLLRNYTQNIDTLEQVAGINNVIQCHGSFAKATCMVCHHKCSSDDIKEEIMNQVIPMCPKCEPQTPMSVMKPDIVFFGESLPEEFHHQMSVDKDECDLLIVIGSSLKVRPVALIPNSLPAHVPQILINKEHLRNMNFDVELLGDCEVVIGELCRRLGGDWAKLANFKAMTEMLMDELLTPPSSPKAQEKIETVEVSKADSKGIQETEMSENAQISSTETVTCNAGNVKTADSSNVEFEDKCQCPAEAADNKSGSDSHVELVQQSGDSGKSADGSVVDKDLSVDTSKLPETGKGQGDCAKTDLVCTDEGAGDTHKKETVEVTPGPSSSSDVEVRLKVDSSKPGSSGDSREFRQMWRPQRQNIASRLGANKYCFVPPCKYIFPEAEFYTYMESSSNYTDSDDDDDDNDTSMNSSKELDHTTTTATGSSAQDAIDLTSDDEKQTAGREGLCSFKDSEAEVLKGDMKIGGSASDPVVI